MILFEKYDRKYNETLLNWDRIFNNVEELITFIEKNKDCILGDRYEITIKEVKEGE